MIFGITRFEIRDQLRNPVFWVAIAIFFLMGFGLTASANVSIGTPGGVHKNAANAIAFATAIFSLFYVFVVTAFVANAIIRDDASGFAPIVRATSVTARQILAGRFLGGLLIAWLGYLALPLGMLMGSLMPWVDPETIGPQVFAYYGWPFLILALPNIFLLCAVLFSLATMLRSMMAAYIGAIVLVMGYLIITGILLVYAVAIAISRVVLPYARSGLLGAMLLGLGRALGETLAVTMVIGNHPTVSASLFAPGATMASS